MTKSEKVMIEKIEKSILHHLEVIFDEHKDYFKEMHDLDIKQESEILTLLHGGIQPKDDTDKVLYNMGFLHGMTSTKVLLSKPQ